MWLQAWSYVGTLVHTHTFSVSEQCACGTNIRQDVFVGELEWARSDCSQSHPRAHITEQLYSNKRKFKIEYDSFVTRKMSHYTLRNIALDMRGINQARTHNAHTLAHTILWWMFANGLECLCNLCASERPRVIVCMSESAVHHLSISKNLVVTLAFRNC